MALTSSPPPLPPPCDRLCDDSGRLLRFKGVDFSGRGKRLCFSVWCTGEHGFRAYTTSWRTGRQHPIFGRIEAVRLAMNKNELHGFGPFQRTDGSLRPGGRGPTNCVKPWPTSAWDFNSWARQDSVIIVKNDKAPTHIQYHRGRVQRTEEVGLLEVRGMTRAVVVLNVIDIVEESRRYLVYDRISVSNGWFM